MNNFIDGFNFWLNGQFGFFVPTFHERKQPIQPFYWIEEQPRSYVFRILGGFHEFGEKMIKYFEEAI